MIRGISTECLRCLSSLTCPSGNGTSSLGRRIDTVKFFRIDAFDAVVDLGSMNRKESMLDETLHGPRNILWRKTMKNNNQCPKHDATHIPRQLVLFHVFGRTVSTWTLAVTFCLASPTSVATGTKSYSFLFILRVCFVGS